MSEENFIQAALQQHAMAQAFQKVMRDRQNHFITDMKSEDLATFGAFLTIVSQNPEAAMYWRGRVDHELMGRGVCPGCGVDHITEEVEHMVAEQHTDIDLAHSAPSDVPENDFNSPSWVQPSLFDDMAEANIAANMEEWGVEPIDPETPLGPVVCIACGWRSASLEDRMLRAPKIDGCPGCQDKSAHG